MQAPDPLIRAVFSDERVHVPVALDGIAAGRVLDRPGNAVHGDDTSRHAWRLADVSTRETPDAGGPAGPAGPKGESVPASTAGSASLVDAARAPDSLAATGHHLTRGFADRYGGIGIGSNGGSGRNVIVGGVQVKGAGRTPLVCPHTPRAHASGGAYLEECVREAIFAAVVGHDFPYGAVPVLEIVDTGETQHWPPPLQPAAERRVLLVRPLCVRPAHFERAVAFDPPGAWEAEQDHERVRLILTRAAESAGPDAFLQTLEVFWPRWAHQLAYGFVHRLPHGNNTSSNIALDGRLLDFGATSATPSWANTATSYFQYPIATRFNSIAMTIRSVYYYVGRHLGWAHAPALYVESLLARALDSFRLALNFEVLRLSGLPDPLAFDLVTGPHLAAAHAATREAIETAQREQLDLLEPAPDTDGAWPMDQLWSRAVPPSLDRLRGFLNRMVGTPLREDCEATHRHRCRTRVGLFKPHHRAAFFEAVESQNDGRLGADPGFVHAFIARHVADGLREALPAATDPCRIVVPFAGARATGREL